MASTQVEKAQGGKPAGRKPTEQELEMFVQILDGGPYPDALDASAMADAIAKRVRDAETFEQAFSAGAEELPKWPLDRPVLIRDFRLNKSTFWQADDPTSGLSAYAVVDISYLDSGENETVQVGGRNVMEQLHMVLRHGWWDKPVKMISKDTGSGYSTLWLVPA